MSEQNWLPCTAALTEKWEKGVQRNQTSARDIGRYKNPITPYSFESGLTWQKSILYSTAPWSVSLLPRQDWCQPKVRFQNISATAEQQINPYISYSLPEKRDPGCRMQETASTIQSCSGLNSVSNWMINLWLLCFFSPRVNNTFTHKPNAFHNCILTSVCIRRRGVGSPEVDVAIFILLFDAISSAMRSNQHSVMISNHDGDDWLKGACGLV